MSKKQFRSRPTQAETAKGQLARVGSLVSGLLPSSRDRAALRPLKDDTEKDLETKWRESVAVNIAHLRRDNLAKGGYRHRQNTPASVWTIRHNLQGYPSVTVVDSAKRRVYGEERFVDTNTVELTFESGFSGEAFLNL